MNRRSFIGSIIALGTAPAIVRAESLMRVATIVIPTKAEMVAIYSGNQIFIDEMDLQKSMQEGLRALDFDLSWIAIQLNERRGIGILAIHPLHECWRD